MGDVNSIYEDPAFRRFHKTEERERKGTLAACRSTQNADYRRSKSTVLANEGKAYPFLQD